MPEHVDEPFLLNPSQGGKARARSLSPERRAEIAQRAAEARWAKDIKEATYAGVLIIGEQRIDCAVVGDGTRVLSQGTVLEALGRARSMGRRQMSGEAAKRAPFLSANNLEPFITEELTELLEPVNYRLPGARFVSVGYRAEALPLICDAYLAARAAGKLQESQEAAARASEILMRSLARVGIIALVDEATGYQEVRARDELRLILDAYVTESFRPWVEVFPSEFFREIYRLYGWDYKPGSSKRPGYVGTIINTYIYDQFPDDVLEELRKVNPRLASGNRSRRHHQHLTVDTGNVHLDRQILAVTTLMQVSDDLDQFKMLFERRFPPTPQKKALRVALNEQNQITTLFEIDELGEMQLSGK